MTTYYRGQKVACIQDGWAVSPADPASVEWPWPCPIKGHVYTVAWVSDLCSAWPSFKDGTRIGLQLVEVSPTKFFQASYFRPVVERKIDISVFTRMLAPNSKVLEEVE